ncbi:hypothetical protein [Acinetobacter nosocomialis]|uniref:hypothetical protein n=1 Tax=Acinetobacter nosocomialis TaxID=106654 RepID=UPI0024DE9CE6|nr:hypothetical protein [Acinetobacter nosocomialis]
MNLEYSYRELLELCDEKKLHNISARISELYANHLTKNWTTDINSEWVCRNYLAAKMILNATVILNALNFSEENGMRLATPYFEYYATLSLARAVVYTLPTEHWNNGELITISHAHAITTAFKWLERFDQSTAIELQNETLKLKAQRELISYRAPSTGDQNLSKDHNLERLLTILAEVAQFNSELLKKSIIKHADPATFVVKEEDIHNLAWVSIDGHQFPDNYDYHRLDYLRRKMPRPTSLNYTMTEGMTEDFIGAWDGEDGTSFSSDDWRIIFDIP